MQVKSEIGKYSPLTTAGIVLGLGIGGFFDGIVFHQLLQWHHMISSARSTDTISDLKANMVGDGLFEAATLLLTVAGIVLLWRAGQRGHIPHSSKSFSGPLLIGAGLFNLVEGLIDHQILGIHHLKPGPHQLTWDIGFLASGVILAALGWLLLQGGQQDTTS